MDKITYLRSALEQMPTEELDQLLRCELEKEPLDGDAARLILSVLRQRDAGTIPEPGPITLAAWEKYRQRTAKSTSRIQQISPWLLKAVSAIAIVLTLFALVPQAAKASGFLDRLVSWTDSIFQLFSPEEAQPAAPGYIFKTDNPGLQQVYNTLTDLGVTQPVVPMWLPEGYELVGIDDRFITRVVANFINRDHHSIIEIDIYSGDVTRHYCKAAHYFALMN